MTDGEEEWRKTLRERLEAGQTISGLRRPLWPEPPIDARRLPRTDRALRTSLPRGPLARYLGQHIDISAETGPDILDFVGAEALARVRAWPVLPLQGASFFVQRTQDIASALRSLLASVLPGIDWWVPEHWDGPFEKYGLLHNSFVAPPNENTGEAMVIEVFGEAEHSVPHGSDECARAMASWVKQGMNEAERPLGVRLPTTVHISVANYVNVRCSGVGIPFYM
jgi:hypothetical protein